ncbi:MAG: DUF748 domain-containing protein [Tunicatimonas sp.]
MRTGSKVFRWLLWAVGTVLSLLLLLQLLIFFFFQPIVGRALKEAVNHFTDGLYQIDYEQLDASLFSQKIALKNVTLRYDTARVNRSARLKHQKYYTGTLRHVDVRFRDFDYFLSGRYLAVDVIDVNQPSVFIHRYPFLSQPDSAAADSSVRFNTYQLIKPYFDSVTIDAISVKRAALGLVRHHDAGAPDSTTVRELGMQVVAAQIDSVAAQQTHGWPAMREAKLWLRDQTFVSSDSLYQFGVDSLGVDPMVGEVLARQVSVTPRLGKYEMGQQLGTLTTWMEWKAGTVALQGVDFLGMTDSLVVQMRRASVEQMELHLFRDLRLPSGEAQTRPLLPKLLQSVATPFGIDTLVLTDGLIRYEERRPSAEQAGYITFADLHASLRHVTNRTSDTTLVLEADVRTKFMNKGQATLQFDFPLTDPHGEHRIRGEMDRMLLTALNPAVEPLAFASIKRGVANRLDFDMRLDDRSATGNVRFLYDDLKINLLKEEEPDKKKIVKSWLANWLVIKESNPTRNKPLRPGPISIERDPTRSMTRYWWLALRSGLMTSVGVQSSPDQEDTASAQN